MPEEQGKDLCVRVALRCRPLISKELSEGCQECVKFTPGEPQVVLGKNKAFTYDYVFRPEEPQDDVYRNAVENLVDGLFKGYNATVLAYGQTGSGKTFAMGNAYNMTDEDKMGVIPRVIRRIFKTIQEKQDLEIILKVSYLEIYKEEIRDLLAPAKKESLAIREDITGGIRVAGLSEVGVSSAAEMFHCLEKGSVGRTVGSTAMNLESSRSHAIYTVYLELKKKDSSDSCCHAKFHLVDLAGSERAKRTQASGDRFKEGVNINRGLLALGNVISALGDEAGRKSHVPYRDSKLTRLLQDSLGGNSQTVMIACISPADSNMEETLNTLRYADRARRIKNKPIVNRDPQTAELNRLREQVQMLQVQLLQGKILNGEGAQVALSLEGGGDLKTLLQRNQKLEAENEKLSHELQASIGQTTQMCEKVILAEMSKDKLKQKLLELRAKADMSIGALDLTLAEDGDGGQHMSKVKEQLGAMKELQEKIAELETDNQREDEQADALYGALESRPTTAASQDGASSPDTTPTSEAPLTPDVTRTHTLRQAALSRELHELNRALAVKQELAKTSGESDEKLEVMKIQYETNMKQLEDQVNTLLKEKETLSHELHSTKANSANNKLSEQRRKRLQELEGHIAEMKKKIQAQSKLLKFKEKSDHTVNKLNSDIVAMKQARVRLMKQMKEETSRFQQWKHGKEKEVLQLKAKDRKRQFEFTRMERQNEKTQNVLRRKMEEAAAANRRLKDALEKKKFRVKNDKPEPNKMEGMGKRIKSWIDHELEVKVSVNEAKRHLGSIINDRKTIKQQLEQLERGEPNALRGLNGTSVPMRVAELQSELELRQVQISDLQQKIMDADSVSDDKTSRWSHVTSMPEAKLCIDRLMEAATLARVEMGILEGRVAEMKSAADDAQRDKDEMDQEMDKMKLSYEQEKTDLQRAHEDKILYLLTQLSADADKTKRSLEESGAGADEELKQRLHFQEEQIEELRGIHEQLQDARQKNEDLTKQLMLASVQGKKSALMPVLTSPEASPIPQPRPKKKKSTALRAAERYTLEELFSEDEVSQSESEMDEDDSDWSMTPLNVRKRKAAQGRSNDQSRNSSNQSCGCKSMCKSRLCGCRKNGRDCGDDCRCDSSICKNRKDGDQDGANQSPDTSTANNSDMLNTTIVIDTSREDPDTPGLKEFKLPAKPKPRTILGTHNGPVSSSSNPSVPKLKRENATAASRKRSSDALKAKPKRSLPDVENDGIAKRKKKLLGSNSGSFFMAPDL